MKVFEVVIETKCPILMLFDSQPSHFRIIDVLKSEYSTLPVDWFAEAVHLVQVGKYREVERTVYPVELKDVNVPLGKKIPLRMDLYQAMCGVIEASREACNHPAVFDASVIGKLKEAHKALRTVMAAAPIYEFDSDNLLQRLRELAKERRQTYRAAVGGDMPGRNLRRAEEIEDEAFRLLEGNQ